MTYSLDTLNPGTAPADAPAGLNRFAHELSLVLGAVALLFWAIALLSYGWATVGSCAQIGKNVHLSGGVGIGGVLEPMQAGPTIIEDDCFIGARSEVVEGCIVRQGSVLGMGVFIGQSTKIVDRETGAVMYGEVPAGSVVVAGSMPSKGGINLYCAVIVKKVDAQTRSKTSINELLRD